MTAIGDIRILKRDQIDDDEIGLERITPAGSIVEIVDLTAVDGDFIVGCPATGGNWFFTQEQWDTLAMPAPKPDNPFKDAVAFSIALYRDRDTTIQQLMQRRVEYWSDLEGVAAGLAAWAAARLDLGDDNRIIGLAEVFFDNTGETE